MQYESLEKSIRSGWDKKFSMAWFKAYVGELACHKMELAYKSYNSLVDGQVLKWYYVTLIFPVNICEVLQIDWERFV